MAPTDVTAEFGKVKPCQPWPQCNQDPPGATATTAFVLQNEGSETEPAWVGLDGAIQDQRPIQVNNATKLDVEGPDEFYTALSATYNSYLLGECLVTNPKNVADWIIDALATEFSMVGHQPVGAAPTGYTNARILIDKAAVATGTPSEENFVSIGFSSGNLLYDFEAVWIRVGGESLQGLPGPTVSVEDVIVGEDNFERYTFSGGTARVVSRAWKPKRRPSIECPLMDPVVVLVKID